MNRRTFLRFAAIAATTVHPPRLSDAADSGLPRRLLGPTGRSVSLLGLGGAHLAQDRALSDAESERLVRQAVDAGIDFLDNAWSYSGGLSEQRMGKALTNGYRERVFLMTKVLARRPKQARAQLEESLRRLRTDHLDLWQFHHIESRRDVRAVYDEGLLDVALEAQKEGKLRYIGFTGHTYPALHLRMIERGFPWDTVQMPINLFDPHYLSFVEQVLPVAIEHGIGVIAMKTMGGTPGRLPQTGAVRPAECLRYAMSLPVSTVCSGMDSPQRIDENVKTAKNFVPFGGKELTALLERTRELGVSGKYEGYKKQP
ncbi:MAG: aldo/keto reductase [Candidatus Latescibacterota bacterium]|nr:aldo/keto reductase [Candidatus Latescibacterota bacterium]